MKKKARSKAKPLEILCELRAKLHDIDQKLDHLIRNLRRFNQIHFDSVDESV
jgi:hypothetical protein